MLCRDNNVPACPLWSVLWPTQLCLVFLTKFPLLVFGFLKDPHCLLTPSILLGLSSSQKRTRSGRVCEKKAYTLQGVCPFQKDRLPQVRKHQLWWKRDADVVFVISWLRKAVEAVPGFVACVVRQARNAAPGNQTGRWVQQFPQTHNKRRTV